MPRRPRSPQTERRPRWVSRRAARPGAAAARAGAEGAPARRRRLCAAGGMWERGRGREYLRAPRRPAEWSCRRRGKRGGAGISAFGRALMPAWLRARRS
ncbi:hypothetical protein B0H17DRAFT_1086420, partial [Mycena rosella]